MESSPRRRLLIAAAAVAAVVATLSLAWRHTALAELLTVERVVDFIEAASGRWWAPLVVVALFTPAALILFPRALITLAAALVFGPAKAFVLALTGVVLSAWIIQAAGRRVSERTVRRMAGPRIEPLTRMLKKQGLMAVAAVGFLPVAPFAVEMLVAGALRIPLLHLLPGVALAHLPGTIFTTLLGDQALAAISQDREMNRAVLIGVALAFAMLAWWTRRWWRRVQAQAA